jgi:hypothetical protein
MTPGRNKTLGRIFGLLFPLFFWGCASAPHPVDQPLIPLKEANWELVSEENEGLEILPQDCKEVRDFYRGGVQQKAKGERLFQDKAYDEAAKLFKASNDFFLRVLDFIPQDDAKYPLFEGTEILFFPNLLVADNYLKVGSIHREMKEMSAAQRNWKRALAYSNNSLQSENTEWGRALRQEIASLLEEKKP